MQTIKVIQERTHQPPVRLKVAAYVRVSHEGLEKSYSQQISYYKSVIQSHPEWAFSGIYSDFAISGRGQVKRRGFQELIGACREGKIDLILTKSISRFGRNTIELLETVRELKLLGIAIRFEKENIDTLTTEGEFLLTLLASVAEEESHSIRENILWKN